MPRRDKEKNRAYQAKWYKANVKDQITRVAKRKIKMAIWFREQKAAFSCKRCGEDCPATIDFHHNDPAVKEMELSRVISLGWSETRILAEIAKCTPLCANCHRKFHFYFDTGQITSIEEWLLNRILGSRTLSKSGYKPPPDYRPAISQVSSRETENPHPPLMMDGD